MMVVNNHRSRNTSRHDHAMNYAEDRLDRRSRFEAGDNSLWKDYSQARASHNHALLARTLRDVGWTTHALYHYGQAWCVSPQADLACGDFAQMAEFAGLPEIGVVALLAWRAASSSEDGLPPPDEDAFRTLVANHAPPLDETWLQQRSPATDCGCGATRCGTLACYSPMRHVAPILDTLQAYCVAVATRRQPVPSTAMILNRLANPTRVRALPDPAISPLLLFWKSDGRYRDLSPLLQMLLVKLLYVCGLPTLASQAVAYSEIPLTRQYKSHHAYFVLIRAVVLGERVKAHRKKSSWHTAVWDVLWPLAAVHGEAPVECSNHAPAFAAWRRLFFRSVGDPQLPPLNWVLPPHMTPTKPIFLVGDSHVLSLAWQSLEIPTSPTACLRRRVIPVVLTGIKAWHTRAATRFFTHSHWQVALERIPAGATILFSAGEIDCREGLGGPQLEGYSMEQASRVAFHVQRTVVAYVQALRETAARTDRQILVLPVAPHGQRRTGRVTSQQSRRATMWAWNQELRRSLVACTFDEEEDTPRVFLLDYFEQLVRTGDPPTNTGVGEDFVLNPLYQADGTHMNSGFATLLGDAIRQSGCDLGRL
jgi:hypothetical protein